MVSYRRETVVYTDAWDWDIVFYFGTLRIFSRTLACVGNGHWNKCDCAAKKRFSSPIVDLNGRPLQAEEWRCLLGSNDGTEIFVMSGKTYRLTGPRHKADGYSIWLKWEEYVTRVREKQREKNPLYRFWKWLKACP